MFVGSENSWGLIDKVFQWIIALLIIWQLFTGFNLSTLEFSQEKLPLMKFIKFLEHLFL